MLLFELKFDLNAIVKFHKEKLLKEYNNSVSKNQEKNAAFCDDNEKVKTEYESTEPVVVGLEFNNIILFTWIIRNKDTCKTFLGLYDINFETSKLIYSSDQEMKIINATVNVDVSLLGFCVVEIKKDCDSNKYIFKSFVAEIAPQNQVLCLAISETLHKLKFLSPKVPSLNKVSHLLFMQHTISISLYHIPLANVNNTFLINEKPTNQKIVRRFLWSQFDMCMQRLYYIELLPQDVEDIHAIALFTVVEFKADGDFQYILNFPLPMNFKMNYFDLTTYDSNFPLSSIISSSSFNMVVLTSKVGYFYLCYQHSTKTQSDSDLATPETLSTDSSKESMQVESNSEQTGNHCYHISYTVCCIHGAYKLNCSSTVQQSSFVSKSKDKLLFTLFNDYLVVYLPNAFLHMLDVGTEHEPGFNLLIRNNEIIPIISPDAILLNYQYFISQSNSSNLIYNGNTQIVYDVKLSLKNVFRYFLCCDSTTRLALIHACVIHLNEKRLIRKFLDRIIQDPANVETKDLIKEFLLSSSYSQMKKVVAYSTDTKIFPFTTQELFRGQVHRDLSGNRVVYLSYKRFDDNLKKQIMKVLCKTKSIFWKHFYSILSFEMENEGKRFSLKTLVSFKPDIIEDKQKEKRESSKLSFKSNLSDMRSRACSMFSSTSALPTMKMSPDMSLDVSQIKNTNIIVSECMISFLTNAYGKELKEKGTNLCKEYTLQQNRCMLSLWKIILKTFNYSRNPSLLLSKELTSEPETSEILLFQILERVVASTRELCYPGFPGMSYLFGLLSIRCLSREQFLQYVDSSVIEIQPDFVLHVLREVNDVSESWKFKLLSYLSREHVYYVLQKWENPLAQKYLVQFKLLKVSSSPIFQSSDITDQFVPVETLLESFDKTLEEKNKFDDKQKSEYVKNLVKKTALMSIKKLQ